MNFYELIQKLLPATGDSCRGFKPELTLCVTIVLMLLARLPSWGRKLNAACIAFPGVLVALYFAAPWSNLMGQPDELLKTTGRYELFDGMLVYDQWTVYFRSVLLLFAALFVVFTQISGIPDREDGPDFYTLILGGTLGMCVMASANHLLTVFLGVEMASVPSYVLAGMLKGRRKSSEAALKYSVYGAGTSGVMLYGISLLAGALGTCHLPTMALQLATLSPDLLAERQVVLMFGGLFVMVGLAFKLSAVPFHFWCPDVFEGASAEVNAFLSVASKAAALALLVRVALGFSHVPYSAEGPSPKAVSYTVAYRAVDHEDAEDAVSQEADAIIAGDHNAALAPVRHYVVGLISLLAAITCTFGNLTAYAQTNIKRLLAYSTIAHAGYMMMPVAAAVALSGDRPEEAERALGALAVYVGVYLFMNLGAFAVVAFLRNAMRSEEIADYAGLIRRCPGVTILFSIILFSLIGLPPLAGFVGKFLAFAALANAQQPVLYALFVIGGLNTALSLFYYLRVVKLMTMEPEPSDRLPFELRLASFAGAFLVLVTAPVVGLGVFFDQLNVWALAAAQHLLS